MAIHTYHINLDERGAFYADVRLGGCNGITIFEIFDFEIFEDGFMKDKHDTAGLQKYLQDLGAMAQEDRFGTEAEADAEVEKAFGVKEDEDEDEDERHE